MRLINLSFEILEQGPGLQGIYKQIELAGRTCYKSLDKITDDSAEGFVNRMIKSQHYAMLEHGTVYLKIPFSPSTNKYSNNPYSKNIIVGLEPTCYITTNYRVLVENGWLDDLQYLCEPTEHHEKRVTVGFTTSNGIMREFTRHRTMSFAVESTRYCNYSKDKFNNEVTFIRPYWYDEQNPALGEALLTISLKDSEKHYLALIEAGHKPQEARDILPLATKCDMVMTGFASDWNHFFRLRTSIISETGKPHPDASALADPLYKEFISRGYLKPLMQEFENGNTI